MNVWNEFSSPRWGLLLDLYERCNGPAVFHKRQVNSWPAEGLSAFGIDLEERIEFYSRLSWGGRTIDSTCEFSGMGSIAPPCHWNESNDFLCILKKIKTCIFFWKLLLLVIYNLCSAFFWKSRLFDYFLPYLADWRVRTWVGDSRMHGRTSAQRKAVVSAFI